MIIRHTATLGVTGNKKKIRFRSIIITSTKKRNWGKRRGEEDTNIYEKRLKMLQNSS